MKEIPLKFYGYLKKDFMLLYKRKKYLYIFILLPIIIAFLFIFLINSTSYTIDVVVCNYDDSFSSREALKKIDNFNFNYLDGDEESCSLELKNYISTGKASLGIEIPRGFAENLENLKQSKINIYYDNTDIAFSNLVSWQVDQSLEPFKREIINTINLNVKSKVSIARYNIDFVISSISIPSRLESQVRDIDSNLKNIEEMETEFIVNPVWVNHKPLSDKEIITSAIAFIFPILSLFVILMLSSTSLIYDRKSLFITRVKSSTSISLYLLAKLFFFIFLTSIQFFIIIALFSVSGANYSFEWLNVVELIVAVALINSLIGFLIGLISENEGIAVLFSLIIAFPLMLVSGIFYPVQTLPNFIQWIASILPLSYQINSAKMVLLFNQSMKNTWIIMSIILFGFVYWSLRRKI